MLLLKTSAHKQHHFSSSLDTCLAFFQTDVVSASSRSLRALLQEQRYRRHFLPTDSRQNAVTEGIAGLAYCIGTLHNDFLLLRGTWTLYLVVCAKLVTLIVIAVTAVLLLRAKWPRQHDRALTIYFCTMTWLYFPVADLTRFPSGEYMGPLIGVLVGLPVTYFAMWGPIWPRAVGAVVASSLVLLLLHSPSAVITRVARDGTTIALVTLNVLAFLAGRVFQDQRRRLFQVQRQEQQARKELAAKLLELAKAKEHAELMARTRTAFLATMSHEFRTPMNAVIGLADLLLRTPHPALPRPENVAHLRTISDSARSLLGMLNDVLDFAKIDAQKLTLSKTPFELRRLADSVVTMLQPLAKARSLVLVCQIDGSLPGYFVGDDVRLRQVLINLLSNGIKFTHHGVVSLHIGDAAMSTVLVDGTKLHAMTVRVSDTGIGMTPAVLARLFQPFEQADAGANRRSGGTGLGLCISQQIVYAMGGEIHVQSEPGRGSVFSFTIQMPAAASSFLPPLWSLLPERLERVPLSILVVDDHPVNRFVASELLEQLGDEVDLASSGADAIEAVARKDYDVVFMDVQMPELNGIETTKQICAQQAGKKLPAIIALTASILEEDREACRAVGMLDFLVKPLDIAQVDSLLGRVAAQRKITAAPEPTQRWRSPEAQTEPRPTSLIDNPQLVSRLCQMFVIDAPVRVAMMQDSLARGDSKDIELRAHSLRTACTMLGASHMAELCAQIEEIARAGRIVELASWVEWLSVESSKVVYALARSFEPGSNAV